MKLKKIASLALAGIMAVSMLAGCNGSNSSNNGDVVVPSTSSTVAAVNNGQSKLNDVKIDFTSGSELTNFLSQLLNQKGESISQLDLLSIGVVTGKTYGTINSTTYGSDDGLNGETFTQLYGIVPITYSATNKAEPLSEEAALEMLANRVDSTVSALNKTQNMTGVGTGNKYYAYSYTGEISDMLTLEKMDGTVSYYAIYTITQTITEKTLEA